LSTGGVHLLFYSLFLSALHNSLRRGDTVFLAGFTNVKRTSKLIRSLAVWSSEDEEIIELAEKLGRKTDPVKATFDYVYENVVYEPDPDKIQYLRYGSRTLKDGVGNCVDYAILISALLYNMRVPHYLKIVAVDAETGFEHIYIVTKSGQVLDCVLGHEQDGTDTKLNRSLKGFYNYELQHDFSEFYKMPNRTKVAVLRGAHPSRRRNSPMGRICLKNCACKNECSGLFGQLDSSSETACRQWCDDVKAKRNGFFPSDDDFWQAKATALGIVDIEEAAETGGTVSETGDPFKNTLEDIADIAARIFGGLGGSQSKETVSETEPEPGKAGLFGGGNFLIFAGIALGAFFLIRPALQKKKK